MKITQEQLEKQADQPKPLDFQENQKKVTIQRSEPVNAYLPYGKEHVNSFGWVIGDTPKQVILDRSVGKKVVTIREADILARQRMNMDNELWRASMFTRDINQLLYIVEGVPGTPDDPWQLRAFYNRGIAWAKTKRAAAIPEKQIKGDEAFKEITRKLELQRLPPWPEEVQVGFAIELTKPEYLNWEQYQRIVGQKRILDV